MADLRARISDALKQAMRDKDSVQVGTLRLINAAIKDRDIAVRGEGNESGVGEDEILTILGRMVKQRKESTRAYEEAGRLELAQQEEAEIAVIEGFLPSKLDDAEVQKAVAQAISETGADSIRDMGKVMAVLKSRFAGRMDFAEVGPMVKDSLG